jgi:hypothetical protein
VNGLPEEESHQEVLGRLGDKDSPLFNVYRSSFLHLLERMRGRWAVNEFIVGVGFASRKGLTSHSPTCGLIPERDLHQRWIFSILHGICGVYDL